MPAVFTIVSLNYLPFARVLMASLAEHHPTWDRYVILVDKPGDHANEPFNVIPSTELEIPPSSWFHFRYNILELNTAVQPYAMAHPLAAVAQIPKIQSPFTRNPGSRPRTDPSHISTLSNVVLTGKSRKSA